MHISPVHKLKASSIFWNIYIYEIDHKSIIDRQKINKEEIQVNEVVLSNLFHDKGNGLLHSGKNIICLFSKYHIKWFLAAIVDNYEMFVYEMVFPDEKKRMINKKF